MNGIRHLKTFGDIDMDITDTLKQRHSSYGDFAEQSEVSQTIKKAFRFSGNYDNLDAGMKESLDMIAVKISRILTGDPGHADSWHDIQGYAALVEKTLARRG